MSVCGYAKILGGWVPELTDPPPPPGVKQNPVQGLEQSGLLHTETRRGMWWTGWTRRAVGSNNCTTTSAATSTTPHQITTFPTPNLQPPPPPLVGHSAGLHFLYGALDSHPFVLRACVGSVLSDCRCGRCSFCGVVAAEAGPSSWPPSTQHHDTCPQDSYRGLGTLVRSQFGGGKFGSGKFGCGKFCGSAEQGSRHGACKAQGVGGTKQEAPGFGVGD